MKLQRIPTHKIIGFFPLFENGKRTAIANNRYRPAGDHRAILKLHKKTPRNLSRGVMFVLFTSLDFQLIQRNTQVVLQSEH